MAEYQVEIEFQIEGHSRDVSLLELLSDELERGVGELGPAVAIHGDRFSVTLTVDAPSFVDAASRAADAITAAGERALNEPVEWHLGRLVVDDELVPA